ncbi:alpha/beta fold hydrolase [Paraburkholderia silviterrae]|uniref:Alpha/beta hydrolase n=1 Tax=Paraburkholderia silviterrae TaxID=2528715 RepID=A0A4R5LYN8_9BURK|nr:alpha/beta hydrolase [Paraburkholderia silviterrae]TDG17491.1 alpha/beta hydrolase [Paraburkholderia silviterrae]
MPFFDRDGVRLWYEERGDASKPAVVFSHGFLMDGSMFDTNIESFIDEFRCIVWDQRGFGKTGEVGKPFSFWDSARDLLALLDHLEIGAAALVGMSQGGFVSMRAALLEPDRVRALALISTRSGADAPPVIESFAQLKAAWRHSGPEPLAKDLSGLLIGARFDSSSWVSAWQSMSRSGIDHPVDALTGRDDLTPQLGSITCPAIVFHGNQDRAIDIAHGRELAQGLPNSKGFVTIDRAGHAPNLTHPQFVNGPLRDFLLRYTG